jgi:transcriptional regulator with XRE-family HTH domain
VSEGSVRRPSPTFLGVHRTYLGGVERGERNLTLRSAERLAAKAGVPVLELLT